MRTYSFRELKIWKVRLPDVKHGLLPPHNDRPNPLVRGDKLFASIFSPGAVCAVNRQNGKLIWRKEIPRLGHAAVYVAAGSLFAKSARTLYALNPESGETIWAFCPYRESGEWIYSEPTVSRRSVFIGDRCGLLHCLDVSSGNTRWNVRTNKAKNCDVNSTPVVISGLAIVATNANRAIAVDVRTGKVAWTCELDGPSILGPFILSKLVVFLAESIYFVRPQSGKIVSKFSWKGDAVDAATNTRSKIIGLRRGKWPPEPRRTLIGVDESGVRYFKDQQGWLGALRYAPQTRYVYLSHFEGVRICRPGDGSPVCEINSDERCDDVGLVDIAGGIIYALTGVGDLYALRHPKI